MEMPPEDKTEHVNDGKKTAAPASGNDPLRALRAVTPDAIQNALKLCQEKFSSMAHIPQLGGQKASGSEFTLFDGKSGKEVKASQGPHEASTGAHESDGAGAAGGRAERLS